MFRSIVSPLEVQQEVNLEQTSALPRRRTLPDEGQPQIRSRREQCLRLTDTEKDRNAASLFAGRFRELPRIIHYMSFETQCAWSDCLVFVVGSAAVVGGSGPDLHRPPSVQRRQPFNNLYVMQVCADAGEVQSKEMLGFWRGVS